MMTPRIPNDAKVEMDKYSIAFLLYRMRSQKDKETLVEKARNKGKTGNLSSILDEPESITLDLLMSYKDDALEALRKRGYKEGIAREELNDHLADLARTLGVRLSEKGAELVNVSVKA